MFALDIKTFIYIKLKICVIEVRDNISSCSAGWASGGLVGH